MAHFRIDNRDSSSFLGVYQGATANDALAALNADAGAPNEDNDDLLVTEIEPFEVDHFRDDNTDGYDADELAAMNRELAAYLLSDGITPDHDDFDDLVKNYGDVVSNRH